MLADLDSPNLFSLRQRVWDRVMQVRDVIEAVERRCSRLEPEVSAYAHLDIQQAHDAAALLDRELPSACDPNRLHGVTVAVKDVVDTSDMPTQFGSTRWRGNRPSADAEIVRQLKSTSAVVLGKSHCYEFSLGTHAPTRNPWNTNHSPGGSSSGSAAAVSAGLCGAAIGTDTGGSVRIPSAFCGVVGLKPTYGAISTTGVAPASHTLDSVGIIARSVQDVCLMFNAVHQGWAPEPSGLPRPCLGASLNGLKVGVYSSHLEGFVQPAVRARVTKALGTLEGCGAELRALTLPSDARFTAVHSCLVLVEAAEFHSRLEPRSGHYEADVEDFLACGRTVKGMDYVSAQHERQVLRRRWNDATRDVDVVVSPTTPVTAPPYAAESITWPGDCKEGIRSAYSRFCLQANVIGAPAISIPCGVDGEGLPVGLQLIGRSHKDWELLAVANAVAEVVQ